MSEGKSGKRQSLTDIEGDMLALDDMLAEYDIDSPEAQEIICKWAEELNTNRDRKVDNICAFIKNTDARSSIREEEAKRLKAKSERDKKTVEWLKQYLKDYFERNNMSKLETDRYTVAIQNNGGSIPVEYSVAPNKLPPEYVRVETIYKPMTEMIRADLEQNKEIPGAALGKRGTSLRIR